MPIWLSVNQHSGVPIYVQIVDQVKHALEVGMLEPGDPLPTVRQLASDLAIAPNTIVRAYNELQSAGMIESRPGVGTVVTASLDGTLRKHQTEALFERLAMLVRDAAGLEIEPDELETRFKAEVARFFWKEKG
jgi:GntR family transcriptional regulator